jgi:phosphatidylserine/phosphatidylglycerophosphate/cardiolipin synthase-like enzyme
VRYLPILLCLVACRGETGGDDDAVDPPDAGGDAGLGCAATDPRDPPTTTFVGPTGLESRMTELIDGAVSSLELQMYLFTVDELADRVIAAHQRGVEVRVLLDPDHEGNGAVRAQLSGAGVPVRDAPSGFEFAHAKYLVIDGETAVITSANFNFGALSSERNYGAITRDPDDVADLAAIFDADWDGGALDLACTRLVVSPVNSRQNLLGLIGGAEATLDLSVIYMSDSTLRGAVIAAHDRGVAVRVLLADPDDFPENADTATTLANQGVEVGYATSFDLHAKLIVADGVAFVGSQNLSPTSLNENREVGVLVTEPAAVAPIEAQFEADWASR